MYIIKLGKITLPFYIYKKKRKFYSTAPDYKDATTIKRMKKKKEYETIVISFCFTEIK